MEDFLLLLIAGAAALFVFFAMKKVDDLIEEIRNDSINQTEQEKYRDNVDEHNITMMVYNGMGDDYV